MIASRLIQFLPVLCVPAGLISVAWAADPPAPDPAGAVAGFLEKRFAALDTDHDGKLSAAEAAPAMAFLAGSDANHDGFITMDEVKARLSGEGGGRLREAIKTMANLEGRFKDLDRDHDGKLSGDELTAAPWLQYLDQNKDGVITWNEAESGVTELAGRITGVGEKPSESLAPPYVPDESVRQAPRRLKSGEVGLGSFIPDLAVTDIDEKTLTLNQQGGSKGTVVALVSTSCPISKRYIPVLARLEKDYAAKGYGFLFVAPTATDTASDLHGVGLTAPVVRDGDGAPLLHALGALATTDVFVLDAAHTLVYRGAVDDQYGINYSREVARENYLTDALDAVAEGRTVSVAATEAPGCELGLDTAPAGKSAAAPTYHAQISRLMQANCQECHRKGGIAPFPMETYEQVVAKIGMVKKVVGQQLMPPWSAANMGLNHSPWVNDRSLAARDQAAMLAWIEAGSPAGDPKDAPVPRQWPGEWVIGKPDVIYQIPQPIAVAAEGVMKYQNVIVDPQVTEDKYVTSWEIQPTAREVVHHVLVFLQKPVDGGKTGRYLDQEDSGAFFAAFVPGSSPAQYPAGFGKLLPAGARFRFQIHYTPNGKATQDQIRLGVRFMKGVPEHVVEVTAIANLRISIPPGDAHHAEAGSIPVPADVKILGLMPHMHVRGQAFRYEVILPTGETRTLLEVPRYDFNWQHSYRYFEPITIPRGSRLKGTAWYDNSPANPANPDPSKTVKWGPQTYDEMMLGYVEYYRLTPGDKTAAR